MGHLTVRGLQCPRFMVKRAHTQAMLTAFCTSSANPGVRTVTTIEFQDGQEPILDTIDLDEGRDADPERELRNRLREQARSVARRIAELRAARKHLNRPR